MSQPFRFTFFYTAFIKTFWYQLSLKMYCRPHVSDAQKVPRDEWIIIHYELYIYILPRTESATTYEYPNYVYPWDFLPFRSSANANSLSRLTPPWETKKVTDNLPCARCGMSHKQCILSHLIQPHRVYYHHHHPYYYQHHPSCLFHEI